jgi:SOS response regulatory protein OraA/RecX
VPEALEVAVRALARRDLTVHELDDRLLRTGFSDEERSETLTRLELAGYLDDARVARLRAEKLCERGYGDGAIRADLDRRGVPPEHVQKALASLEPEHVRAARLAAAIGDGSRAARTLARKGFASDSIERVAGAVAERY